MPGLWASGRAPPRQVRHRWRSYEAAYDAAGVDHERFFWFSGRILYHEPANGSASIRTAEFFGARAVEMLRRGYEYEETLQEWGRIGDSGQ